jgi:hypothetical protein
MIATVKRGRHYGETGPGTKIVTVKRRCYGETGPVRISEISFSRYGESGPKKSQQKWVLYRGTTVNRGRHYGESGPDFRRNICSL